MPNNAERKNVYFVSDFHLGAPKGEESRLREQRVVAFLQSIEKDARQVFLLGDIFDFWFEYKKVVPKGYVRILGQLARMTDMGIKIDFFCGNHDLWQRNYFEKELGITVHKHKTEEIVIDGKTFVLGHGDGLDSKDYGYLFIRFIFKNPVSKAIFTSLPATLGLAMATSWSGASRKSHKEIDFKSMGDKEPILLFCKKYLDEHSYVDYFVFGHRHLVTDIVVKGNVRYLNTGVWFEESPYAVWNGETIEIKYFK
ncbi:MAG: UDP-2,3-diacylglucosamine diphosphatase [Bacteroidales bacterium]|nr:UDP-2,3-diacylglucosamine diphosphatase [Candidatus Scybalousia scybalohippi]